MESAKASTGKSKLIGPAGSSGVGVATASPNRLSPLKSAAAGAVTLPFSRADIAEIDIGKVQLA